MAFLLSGATSSTTTPDLVLPGELISWWRDLSLINICKLQFIFTKWY